MSANTNHYITGKPAATTKNTRQTTISHTSLRGEGQEDLRDARSLVGSGARKLNFSKREMEEK